METPNITQAQILSTILGVIGFAVSQGLLDDQTAQTIGGIASVVIPAVWQIADAIIRHGRAGVAKAAIANSPESAVAHHIQQTKAKHAR